MRTYQQIYYWNHRDAYLTRSLAQNRAAKLRVINHYTKNQPGCQCPGCDVKGIEFLTVDHIAEDGAIQRKRQNMAAGTQTYLRLIRNDFPCGIQILCFNCNAARSFRGHGICPHVKKMKEKKRKQ